MDYQPQEVADIKTNIIRRCGSMPKPAGFVSAFKVFEAEKPLWDKSQIKDALQDPNRRVARKTFPSSFITDQHSTSACNGWARAAAQTRARFLKSSEFQKPENIIIFSGSYPYSLINGGRDQGSSLEDGMKVKGGVSQTLCPWNMIYRKDTQKFDAEAAKHTIEDAYAVMTQQGLETAGAAGYMIVVAVMVGNSFQSLDANGLSGSDNGMGNHAIIADDMLIGPDGEFWYDYMMDWGLTYGQQGKGYLTWDRHFRQTFPNHQFYAVPTTAEH